MDHLDARAVRGLLAVAAACAVMYLFAAAALELLRAQQQAEIAVARADTAAYAIGLLLQEARDITEQAARDGGTRP